MYNGDFYIYDDTGDTSNQGLYRITFNTSGTATTITRVAEPVVCADLGDLSINAFGMAYIISSGTIYRFDLSANPAGALAPSSSWTTVGTVTGTTGSQLFFRGNGDLIGSNSGSLIKINPDTAANEGVVAALTGFAWNDLSEAPALGYTCSTDTDGDGIPNHLDLDSDNDGCPDAIEADGPFINSNLVTATGPISSQTPNRNLGNTVGNTPVTFGVPTIAGIGQAIGSSQTSTINSCLDSDNDGIPNSQDLDDDNDGILDALESPSCFYTAAEIKSMITNIFSQFPTTDNFNLLYNGVNETTVAAGFNFTTAVTSANNYAGSNLFTINFNDPVELATLTLTHRISSTAAARAQLFGSNNNFDFVQLSNIPGGVNINTAPTFTVAQNAGKYKYYRIQTTVAGDIATTDFIAEFNFTLAASFNPSEYPKPGICSADNDGDGIPNHLDLDSDGDGCTDAIEGGATFTTANLVTATGTISTQTPNQNLGNTVGNTATTMGVPTIATTGQTIGNSQSLSKNDCLDSDGDGIPDWQDVDDDNDGILDTAENECLNAIFAGYPTTITPINSTDFGRPFTAGVAQNNLNLTADLSHKFGHPPNSGAVIVRIFNAHVHPTANEFYLRGDLPVTRWEITGSVASIFGIEQGSDYYPGQLRSINMMDNAPIPVAHTPSSAGNWTNTSVGNVYTLQNLTGVRQVNTGLLHYANSELSMLKRFEVSTNESGPSRWSTYFIRIQPECDTDKDGIPNRLDLDSDADGCSDALEGAADIQVTQLLIAGGTLTGGSTNVNQNICTTCVSTGGANIGLPQFTTVPASYSNATGQTIGASQNAAIAACFCTQPPAAGTGEITKVGISVQQKQEGWPQNFPNGHIVLESKEKGFVITRFAHVSFVPQATDSIATPFAGMLVYDIQDSCVKLYNGINWKCLQRSCNTASN